MGSPRQAGPDAEQRFRARRGAGAGAANIAAFHLGNAGGAWLGGLAIERGLGYTAPNWIGALLAVGGLAVAIVSVFLDRRVRSGTGPESFEALQKTRKIDAVANWSLLLIDHGEALNTTRAMTALALGGFGIGTTEFATMGLLPQIAETFGIPDYEAGHAISLYAAGVVVGAPLIAVLGAKLPRKGMLIGLMLAVALGNGLSAAAQDKSLLLIARFVAGLPHGAFFGIAAVVAATLVAPERRGTAVARVMVGLTVANLVGVPLATAAGQQIGWRTAYLAVSVIALVTAAAIAAWVPLVPKVEGASMKGEVRAFGRPTVWFAIFTGMIGFGGMFAVYSYVAPLTTEVAGLPGGAVPWILAVFGLGMTLGATFGGRFVDRSVTRSVFGGLIAVTVILVLFGLTASIPVFLFALLFLLGFTIQILAAALQVRLMDASPDAPSLAASSNHSSLNVANGAGAWLGGLAIAAGWGYTSTAWVGVALSVAGLAIAVASVLYERRAFRRETTNQTMAMASAASTTVETQPR